MNVVRQEKTAQSHLGTARLNKGRLVMPSQALPVYFLLILTPLIIACGQVLFKIASQRIAASGDKFYMIMLDPVFIFSCAVYAAATLLWTYVLQTVPLAYAYAFMALTFVMVPILAIFWLGETITLRYIIGGLLILVGLVIAQT